MALAQKITRPAGLEPATYGLEKRRCENEHKIITSVEPVSYPNNYESFSTALEANLSENKNKIQDDLQTIIHRWPSLAENVKRAIMILISDC
jgi:hypothetical protein